MYIYSSCTRIVGRHTYDVLGASIEQIHNSFGLSGKITATITDNGSNFIKAFSLFHQSSDSGSVSVEEATTLWKKTQMIMVTTMTSLLRT